MIVDKEILVTHYGASTYDPRLFKPITNRGMRNKPEGGLWTSPPKSTWGWMRWCRSEGYHLSRLRKRVNLIIKGKFLVIDEVEDLYDLPWRRSNNLFYIDFEALDPTLDAIHLTVKGEDETRFNEPGNLYGWDCETVLVLNKAAILEYSND